MFQRSFLFIAFILLAACSSSRSLEGPQKYKSFELTKVHNPYPGLKVWQYNHTKSGMQVFLTPQKDSEVVAFVVGYDVGSRFEQKGKTGMAHLFEHMMFRGTESYPNPFKTLSSWGNKFNAYTTRDKTVYYEIVPSELLPEVTKFESERMRKLLITPQGFNQEKGAVVSERKMRTEDSPVGRMFWEIYMQSYRNHPYRIGPIGFQKDLDASKYEDALEFYQKFYAPNRAVISITGGFDMGLALEELEKNFGPFDAVELDIPEQKGDEKMTRNKVKTIHLKTESPILAIATNGTAYGDKDVAAEVLMCVLLADSEIGYLGNTLVEKGQARTSGASCSPSILPGLSLVYLLGAPGDSVSKLSANYKKALRGFKKWLTKERLENLKLYFMASQLSSLREPSDLGESLVSSYLSTKDPLWSMNFLKEIEKVSYDDVIRRFDLRMKAKSTQVRIKPSSKNDLITGG